MLNKTASASRDVFDVRRFARAARAQRLRLIRAFVAAIPPRQCDRNAYAREVGDLKHRITVRLTDAHVAHLQQLAGASGLTRNEVMRRVLSNTEIPSARTRQEVQDPPDSAGTEPGCAGLGASPVNVARKMTEASIRSAFALVPDVHRCPARRFAARRTLMAESMSSRFMPGNKEGAAGLRKKRRGQPAPNRIRNAHRVYPRSLCASATRTSVRRSLRRSSGSSMF